MFRFKEFELQDDLCAMKVGTDGVLLGAWADLRGGRRVLDMGTGSGLIALMAAQRVPTAEVVAIDIDHGAARQARANVAASPWSSRIEVLEADVREFNSERRFSHIVSNPPFFVDSLHSPNGARTVARHTTSLTFDDIVAAACRLLDDGGVLSLILPTDVASDMRYAAFGRLWLCRQTDVATREGDAPKRTLMEFVMSPSPLMPRVDSLLIHSSSGGYSEAYRRLVEEFYLKF